MARSSPWSRGSLVRSGITSPPPQEEEQPKDLNQPLPPSPKEVKENPKDKEVDVEMTVEVPKKQENPNQIKEEAPTKEASPAPQKCKTVLKIGSYTLDNINQLFAIASLTEDPEKQSIETLLENTNSAVTGLQINPNQIALYLEGGIAAKPYKKTQLKIPAIRGIKNTISASGKKIPIGAQSIRAGVAANKAIQKLKSNSATKYKRPGVAVKKQQQQPAKKSIPVITKKQTTNQQVAPAISQADYKNFIDAITEAKIPKREICLILTWWDPVNGGDVIPDLTSDPLLQGLDLAMKQGILTKIICHRIWKHCKSPSDFESRLEAEDLTFIGSRTAVANILEHGLKIEKPSEAMLCGLILIQRAYSQPKVITLDPPLPNGQTQKSEADLDDFMSSIMKQPASTGPLPEMLTPAAAVLSRMHTLITKSFLHPRAAAKGIHTYAEMVVYFENEKKWILSDLKEHGVEAFGANLFARAEKGETDPVALALIWILITRTLPAASI